MMEVNEYEFILLCVIVLLQLCLHSIMLVCVLIMISLSLLPLKGDNLSRFQCFLTITFTYMTFWIVHTHTGAWKHNPSCPSPPSYVALPFTSYIRSSLRTFKALWLSCVVGRLLVILLFPHCSARPGPEPKV